MELLLFLSKISILMLDHSFYCLLVRITLYLHELYCKRLIHIINIKRARNSTKDADVLLLSAEDTSV